MKEIWKPIPGYKDLYEVSNMGRVRRASDGYHYRKHEILPFRLWKGYPTIVLYKNGKKRTCKINRLVLLVFIGPCPKGKESSHFNDVKTDNKLKNLAWMTKSENCKLAYKNGRIPPFYGKHHSKKSKEKMSLARIGRKLSEKTKAKMSLIHKGKKLPEETKRKMSIAAETRWKRYHESQNKKAG